MKRKVFLITLACSVLIAYGVFQGRLAARSDMPPRAFTPKNVAVDVLPPAGSRFVRSYESTVNGRVARVAHYSSGLPAAAVVDRFIQDRAVRARVLVEPNVITGPGCVAAAYPRGADVVSIVVFEAPNGCDFFVARSPVVPVPAGKRPPADMPGTDAPGVPRPLNSVRLLSVENPGGIPSVLAFYECWGDTAENADYMATRMSRQGWKESPLAEELMGRELPGEVLSFSKGTKHCMVYLERNARSGKTTVAVLYREKDWLPPGRQYD